MGEIRFVPGGMVTGIGSVPHGDAATAVEVVMAKLKDCPFWPQLPKKSHLEGMTPQYVEGFPALTPGEEGKGPVVNTDDAGVAQLEQFYEKVFSGKVEEFGLSEERAEGYWAFEKALDEAGVGSARYLKAHITGPVTMATSLKSPDGREIVNSDAFREAVASFMAQKALWQVKRLEKHGLPIIVFLDEPVMEVFGSAFSTLNEEMVLALWEPTLTAMREAGALTGIHCCGNTDWGLLFRSGTDIVNFDAFHFLDKMLLYPKEAEEFMEKGGAIAWGGWCRLRKRPTR